MKKTMSIDAIMFLVFVFGILVVNGGPGRTTTASAAATSGREGGDVGPLADAAVGDFDAAPPAPVVADGG